MINNLKLGFKTLKYAHAVKSTMIFGIIIVILGEVLCLMSLVTGDISGGGLPGGYFFMLTALFILQLLYSVNMSNLVQASPMKKKLQTSVPATLSTFCMLIGYLLAVVTEGFVAYRRPESMGVVCGHIIFTVVMMAVIMLYTSVCYKYFFAATVMFLVVFFLCFGYMTGSGMWLAGLQGSGWETFALIAVLGAAALLVFGVLQYFLSLAVYKAPMSKRAQAAALRRQL